MSGFTKLFSEIVTSSIWGEDDKTRLVWITMLATCDAGGVVRASVSGLAHIARVERGACERALEVLFAPDLDSRSLEFEGRRIEKCEGGWQILNYLKYREARQKDERKAYMTNYMRHYRQSHQPVNNPVNCKQKLAVLAKAEAEAEAEADLLPSEEIESPERKNQSTRFARVGCAKFEEFWASLPKENRIAKGRTRESWQKALRNGATVEQIINGISSYVRYEKKRKHQTDYKPLHPSTWLNQGRFEDDCVVTDQTNGHNDDSWMRSVYG